MRQSLSSIMALGAQYSKRTQQRVLQYCNFWRHVSYVQAWSLRKNVVQQALRIGMCQVPELSELHTIWDE